MCRVLGVSRNGFYAWLRRSESRRARDNRKIVVWAKAGKKFKATTDSNHKQPVAENLLDRQFTVAEPNRVWVGDIERHEALSNRAVVRGHGRQFVAADWLKLRAA